MNKFIFTVLTFGFFSFNAYAQPEFPSRPIGCHNAQLANLLNLHKPSLEELQLLENSNKRSDTFDIENYTIYLDVTEVAAKKLNAHTKVFFKTKMNQLESMTLDLKKLIIDSIIFEGNKINFNYDSSLIVLFFGKKLDKDYQGNVEVFYRGVPQRDPIWGGVYFVDKYIYNLGIGLSTTPPNFGKVWFPSFDNFVERSTYDYYVKSLSPTRAYCVGHLVEEDSLGSGITRHYRMDFQIPTYLSSFAVSDYVVDRSITTSIGNSNLPIDLIARSSELNEMKTQFAKIPEALDAFEFWFGPYKFERIGFVATTVGAMEHPTNTAYPISTITSGTLTDNEALFSHEFGHQWWGNLTTLDDAKDMWIKEGNAEYSAHLFLEYAYGKKKFLSKVRENLGDIIFNAHINDGAYLPLSPMPYEHTYGTHTYKKGAAMIHNLRAYLGDSLYRNVCHTIFDSLTGRSMNAYEFRDFINRSSTVPVNDFFNDFIFNKGYPGFYVDSFYQSPILSKNIYNINIVQKLHHADHLCTDVPLKISLYDNQFNRIIKEVKVSGNSTWVELELPIQFASVVAIIVNEDQGLNYAALQDNGYFKSSGSIGLIGSAMTPSIASISDSAYINIVHHLVGPSEGTKHSNVLKLSSTHFWQVTGIAKGNLKMNGRVDYNGSNASSLDYDILKSGEDSVILVYRKNFSEEWREYKPSSKLKVSPNDLKGFIRLDEMIPGEYALAYGYSAAVNVQDIPNYVCQVYPNPANDYIQCTIDHADVHAFQLYNAKGNVIRESVLDHDGCELKIDICELSSGQYWLLLLGKNKQLLSEKSFVVLK